MRRLIWPIVGSAAVLILSPGLELATGSELAYILVLPGLILVFWSLHRISRREVGLRWGSARGYAAGLVVPVAVMAVLAAVAWLAGAVRPPEFAGSTVARRLLLMFLNTLIGGLISEEGYFRGWLWGSWLAAGKGQRAALLWTTLVFTLWHLPVAVIEPDFRLPAAMIPVYLGNVLLLGGMFGVLRLATGSIVVASFAHAVWNALAYVLFGYGAKAAALGIESFWLFGPERGLLGLAVNVLALAALWRWLRIGQIGDRMLINKTDLD